MLRSLILQNFKGFERFELPIHSDKPTVLTGKNGTGKTSLLQAIEFVLTGNNPTRQPRQEGLLRYGADSGFVALQTDAGSIRRTMSPHKLLVEGHRGKTLAGAEGRLSKILGCELADLGRAIRPDLFLRLKFAERTPLLYELLEIHLDAERLQAEVEKVGGERELPTVEVWKDVYGVFDSNIDAAHSELKKARTRRKKQRDEVKTVYEKLEADAKFGRAPVFAQAPDAEEYRWIQEERDGVISRLSSQQYQNQQRERLAQRVARLEAELGNPPCYDEEAEHFRQQYQTVSTELRDLQELGSINRQLNDLKSQACPTCSREWEDLADREDRTNRLLAELEQVKFLEGKRLGLKSKLDAFIAYQKSTKALTDARQQLAETEQHDLCILQAKLDELSESFEAMQTRHLEAAQYEQWVETKNKAKRRCEKLQTFVDALEALVELTGPKGLKKRVMRESSAPAAEQVSAILSEWEMGLAFTDELEILVTTADGRNVLFQDLSDGESLLVALAFQVWLAQKCGLRLLVLDRIEALDHDNQDRLFMAAQDLLDAGEINHAIFAGVGIAATAADAIDLTEMKEASNV